jgi:hypothetical protein
MPAVAEYICQACRKVTWSAVPLRTDTMPACACGGRRQIVRIRHRLRSDDAPGRPSDEHSTENLVALPRGPRRCLVAAANKTQRRQGLLRLQFRDEPGCLRRWLAGT